MWRARGLRVCWGGGRPKLSGRAREAFPRAWPRRRRLLCFERRSETPTLSPTPRGGLGAAPGRLRRRYLWVRNGDARVGRGARPGLGQDGLNGAEAPGGGGGSRATRAGSGYGGARGSRSPARGSGRCAARQRPPPASVAVEAGGPGPRGGRARVLVRSWDKAPSRWRSRDPDPPTLVSVTPTFNNGRVSWALLASL